jgi:hypothetical protein
MIIARNPFLIPGLDQLGADDSVSARATPNIRGVAMQVVPFNKTVARGIAFAGIAATLTLSSTAAFAQCVERFPNLALTTGGNPAPVAQAFPLGNGSSIGALTSTLSSINTAFLTTTSAFVSGGSGAWARGVAGAADITTSSTGTLTNGTNPNGFNLSGSVNCNTSVRQEFIGLQTGMDISSQSVNGGRWNWGVMGGRLDVKNSDQTGPGVFNNANTGVIPATSFTSDTGLPYVGLYTAYSQGSFFADAQIRWDFYSIAGKDPANIQPFSFSGTGMAITANAGYSIPLSKDGWFLEPSGGIVWSKTGFDTISIARNPALGIGSGTVAIDDITSVIGRVSLRIGQNITVGKILYQPFGSYSLFHEFNGDVTVRSTANNGNGFNGDGLILTTTSTGGLGTYHQFALGAAAVLPNNVTLYARGDYKFGDNIEGYGLSGGVRVPF